MTTVLTLAEIRDLVDVPKLISEIEAGFVLYSQGQANVPPVGFLHFDHPPGDVHIKYGAIEGDDCYVLKMASAFYKNAELGLPVSNGVILVLSRKTGELELVLVDECWLTDMRTAAAGAVAAKRLAPKNVDCIGIVGTGTQARLQLQLLRNVVDCKRCVVWGRNYSRAEQMVTELSAEKAIREWGIEIVAKRNLADLVAGCNLIVTTTSAKSPLIGADMVRKGSHITAMGSDDKGKQELDAALLGKADLVVADSVSQCIDHGECRAAIRENVIDAGSIVELGNVLSGRSMGRSSAEQITIADLTGVAVQDIQIAKLVDRAYRQANGRGSRA